MDILIFKGYIEEWLSKTYHGYIHYYSNFYQSIFNQIWFMMDMMDILADGL